MCVDRFRACVRTGVGTNGDQPDQRKQGDLGQHQQHQLGAKGAQGGRLRRTIQRSFDPCAMPTGR